MTLASTRHPSSSTEPSRPATPQYSSDPDAATRHLCAGAYLDDDFRNDCLSEVYYQPKRLTAPSYGFDLSAVLGHCLHARNLSIWRDATIVVAALAATYVSWLSVLAGAAALIGLRVIAGAWRLADETVRKVATGVAIDTTKSPSQGLRLLLLWALAWLALIAVAAKVVSSVVASLVGPEYRLPTDTAIGKNGGLLLALFVLTLPVAFALWRQRRLETLSPGHRPPSRRTPRMDEITRQQGGNTVVYSAFEPFIGSGEVLATWGFAQRLVRAVPEITDLTNLAGQIAGTTEREREFEELPFSANDLVNFIGDEMRNLMPERPPEEQIPGMTVEDRIYLSGTEVGGRTYWTSHGDMAAIIRNPTMPARHYLACQVVSWGGELVTTVYVHIAVQGRSLYLELTSTILAPCKAEYHIVDEVEGTGFRGWLRALGHGILETPRTIVRAPSNLIRSLAGLMGSAATSGKAWGLRSGYDFGARVGVRELGTRDRLRDFTQRQDIYKFKRLIERRVIASVLDFLDDHRVDTAEYRTRAASVLNVGIANVGGDPVFNGPTTGQNQAPPSPSE